MKERCFAFCYLKAHGDAHNTISFYETYVVLKTAGRDFNVPYAHIQLLKISVRRMLFPIIIGALVSIFGFISMQNGIVNFWWSLMLFLFGALFVFYGYLGKEALFLDYGNKHQVVFVNYETIKLQNTLDFYQNCTFFDGNEVRMRPQFYYSISSFEANPNKVRLYYKNEISNANLSEFGLLDFINNPVEIVVDYSESGQLFADLSSAINKPS